MYSIQSTECYLPSPSLSRIMNAAFLSLMLLMAADTAQPFAIEVVDEQTGRGVPLVELTTVSGVTYVTDSAGLIAFHDAGLMDQRVFFHVKSHGYQFRPDVFRSQGVALDVKEG